LDDGDEGKIEWDSQISMNSSWDLDSAVEIDYASITVDSSALPALNTDATLTMRNLVMADPTIKKDGSVCGDCTVTSWDKQTGTLVFTVTEFSEYTAEEANQSKVQNDDLTNTSMYLFLEVQKNVGGSWTSVTSIYNDSTSRILNKTDLFKLDALFNGLWNTSDNGTGDGEYRVYAAARDNESRVLMTRYGEYLNDTYNYYVDTTAPNMDLTLPANGTITSQTSLAFEFTAIDNLDTNMTCNLTFNRTANKTNFAALNNSVTSHTIEGFQNGTYYWNVTCWDEVGNTNTSPTYEFTIDTAEPTIVLNAPWNRTWSSDTDVVMNYTVTGINLDTCILYGNFSGLFSENETNSSPISGIPHSWNISLDQGSYHWNVMCNKTNGVEYWANVNYTFHVDNVVPAIILNYPENGNYSGTDDVVFNWTVTDNLAETIDCNFTLDGERNASMSDITNGEAYNLTVKSLSGGIHYWNVTCWDQANNTNTSKTYNFTVDTEVPHITLNFPPDNMTSNISTVNFNWTAIDNNEETFECNLTIDGKLNATVTVTNNTPYNISLDMNDGTYLWNVTCWDSLDNTNTSNTWNLTIDTTEPAITLNYPDDGFNTSDTTGNIPKVCTIIHI
jgi:hypothetical protein